MTDRWFLELVDVAEGDVVYSHDVGERLWLAEGSRVTIGRTPGADVHCLGRGQGGRMSLTVLLRDDVPVAIHAGHTLPIWHRAQSVRGGQLALADGDTIGPAYGIRFVVGRADPGALPGLRRVGPAVAFAAPWLDVDAPGGAPRVFAGFLADDPRRALVDVHWLHEEVAADGLAQAEAQRDSGDPEDATFARVRDAGTAPGGAWVITDSTIGPTLAELWRRTRLQGATVDASVAAFIVREVARGAHARRADIGAMRCVLRFADGQPLLLTRPRTLLFPRLTESDNSALSLECAALFARCLAPRMDISDWYPPVQARAQLRAALANAGLEQPLRDLLVAAVADRATLRPPAAELLDALAVLLPAQPSESLRALLGQVFPEERARFEAMREAAGVVEVASLTP